MNLNKYLKGLAWWETIIVLIFLFAFLFGLFCFEAWLLMIVWNVVIPTVFITLNTITFWQAFYLLLLVWIFRSWPIKFGSDSKSE